ncbi:UDP-N-acetylglucosamine 2-epimerase, partial [Anaerotruncus colihominis]|uniref:UDP-N-acetylglucosamine 2-epimerase n=1 Tax=Anaerotruncus colihominis TaxID=169435 RepID=UPI00210D1019
EKPDWILLAGDRGEQLIGAMVGGYTYTPVAHIQAGELSGNIDGMTRHAIGKYDHVHFASNADAAQRLLNLGEEPFRVHNVGAPQLDEMVQSQFTPLKDIEDNLCINL